MEIWLGIMAILINSRKDISKRVLSLLCSSSYIHAMSQFLNIHCHWPMLMLIIRSLVLLCRYCSCLVLPTCQLMRQQFFLAYKRMMTSTGHSKPPLNKDSTIYTKQMPNHLPSDYLFSSVKPLSHDLPAYYFVCLHEVGYGCLGRLRAPYGLCSLCACGGCW